ncbi:MAG: cupin domain-containing protein [Candidatus Rariloculaceae bacterium]
MKMKVLVASLVAAIVTIGCASIEDRNSAARVTTTPIDDIDWLALPDGRAVSTVHGDRTSGEHTTYVRFPAGMRTAVHMHSNTYDGVVVAGVARHFEPGLEESAIWLSPGSVYRVPAETHHISQCADESFCIFAIHQHGALDRTVVD